VEVKIVEELMLITCNTNMTISEMSLVALSEYDAAHLNHTPKNIQHVKDSKGRILSGSIKLGGLQNQDLFEIIVYDESYVQSKLLEPPTLKMMYEKWSVFTVYQMKQYLTAVTNSDNPPVSFESRELFGLLDELKHSKSSVVQGHVISCLEMMLTNSRNVVLLKYVADELHSLFRMTSHENIALEILKSIQKLHKLSNTCIKVEELMDDVYAKIKTFGGSSEEFMRYCEYEVEHESAESPTETAMEEKKESTGGATRHSHTVEEEEEEERKLSPFPSGRMGLYRLLELLQSDDVNCRGFALDKLNKTALFCQAQVRLGSTPRGANRVENDDIRSEIRGPEQTDELIRALFSCLKKSIRPPGELLPKTCSKVHQPLSFLIADKALHSPDSNFTAVQSCITCIHWLVKHWGFDSSVNVLSEKWRILLTLSHASDRHDEDLSISEKCGELLILLTNMHGWKKYNIKLEKDSITYFLGSEHPLMRTILALSYIRGNYNFEALKNQNRGEEVSSILCSGDYANLRSIWRWSIGNYSQNVCIQALEVLSSALVLSEVKSHLIKYRPIDKLIRLMEKHINSEVENQRDELNSDKYSQHGTSANIFVIRFTLKAVVNLSGGQQDLALERALNDNQLCADLATLATQDDLIGFYTQVLGIE